MILVIMVMFGLDGFMNPNIVVQKTESLILAKGVMSDCHKKTSVSCYSKAIQINKDGTFSIFSIKTDYILLKD